MSTEQILERAAAELPGVTRTYLSAEFESVVREFLRMSRFWRRNLTGMDTKDKKLYLADYVSDAAVMGVIGPIGYGTRWIIPSGYPMPPVRQKDNAPDPSYYTLEAPHTDVVEFHPGLVEDITDLDAHVYLTPLPGGCATLPDSLFMHYFDPLLDGLVGRMMLKPRKPYSQASVAAAKLRAYNRGRLEARAMANKGRTSSHAPWRYPAWE